MTRNSRISRIAAAFMVASLPMFAMAPLAAAQTIDEVLADTRVPADLETPALQERFRFLRDQVKSGQLQGDILKSARQKLVADREELVRRKQAAGDSQQSEGTAQTQEGQKAEPAQTQEGQNAEPAQSESQQPAAAAPQPAQEPAQQPAQVSPEAVQQAEALLADQRSADSLDDKELRQRLKAMRDLLQAGQLPGDVGQQLRGKLRADREVFRARVAAKQAAKEAAEQTGTQDQSQAAAGSTTVNTTTITNTTNITNIVNNPRPADELSDAELKRRIRLLRQARAEKRLADADAGRAQELIERDRVVLRARLFADRDSRRSELALAVKTGKLSFAINVAPPPEPQIVYAEVSDEVLFEQMVAAPRIEPRRAYTVDEIVADRTVLAAIPSVEIDTVRFGFGEYTLNAEEALELDRIAEIIERIVAARPGEVFLIEGHTDAVGSDAANLELSRKRAATIGQILSEYYTIPSENLREVGLGERFLKIPTEEPEAENRRVSIRRITPYLTGRLN